VRNVHGGKPAELAADVIGNQDRVDFLATWRSIAN
jgi:hypothetical protein